MGIKTANSVGVSPSLLRGVMFGGNVNNDVADGLFAVNANNAPSNANWNYGASLSYK